MAIRRDPGELADLLNEPRAPELAIMKTGFNSSKWSSIAVATSSVASVR